MRNDSLADPDDEFEEWSYQDESAALMDMFNADSPEEAREALDDWLDR